MSESHDRADRQRADCFISSTRRDFLRESFLEAAGALIALGVARNTAFAMPLEIVEAAGRSGGKRSYAIPSADTVQIDKDNEVILVRWENAVYAFNLACPHQNTALKWDDRVRQFQCPKHHSTYKPWGEFIEGRATRPMDRLSITKDGTGGVIVDVDQLFQQDKNPSDWAAAVVKLGA